MTRLTMFADRMRRFRGPVLALLTILQRSPAVRLTGAALEYALEGPTAALLKAGAASIAALGAIDSMAGASNTGLPESAYSYTLETGSPAHPSPYSVAAGVPIASVAFTLVSNPTQAAPQSWAIAGPMPPGLSFGSGSQVVTGLAAGSVGLVNVANPVLSGTPTQAGDYVMQLQAYQLDNAQGYYSSTFTYEIVVSGANAAPAFTTQPISETVLAGGSVTFSVTASGYPVPTYQWNLGSLPVSGANGATLTISNADAANAGNYTCVATNSAGSVTSNVAILTISSVSSPPGFTTQPAGQTVAAGGTVVFSAVASGSPTPTYQWFLNTTPVLGATGPTLVLHGVTAANEGSYTCTAANSAGGATSRLAGLTVVTTQDVGRLVNISCRAGVGTGGNILIVGFVSGGAGTSGTQPVLIRGTGPALIPYGVTGTLADPKLTLYQGSTSLESDTGWGANAAQITAEDTAVGAFALTNTASLDSALYVPNLAPNGYTAQIAGTSGDTGVALAEVYDATPAGAYVPASPRITNVSARVEVGTGGNILIAGFVIGGSTSMTVLIRASGPALGPFGVTGVLADPELQLFKGMTLEASDSGWLGNPDVASAAASVGAFAWTDALSKDSALIVTLPPGSYTAQVAGSAGTSNDTGVALVEVYEVP
jgi:hypothetical protein